MSFLERLRNSVERNRLAEFGYNTLASVPGYRGVVMRRVRDRIETVRRERCFSLMIELSSVCNARCVFCPHSTMKRQKRVMDDATFDLILSRLKEEKIAPPIIDLFDVGEPLIDRKFFKRAKRLRQEFPKARISTTSNFAVATPVIIDQILSCGLTWIRISLNAASPSLYRKTMGLDYAKTLRNIELLLEKRRASQSSMAVFLSMVVSDQSRNETRDFIQTWGKRVDSIILQRAHDWFGGLDRGTSYAPTHLYPCNDLFERIVLLSNGEMALCCADSEGTGLSIRNRRILDVFNSEAFENLREVHLHGDIRTLKACRNCFGVHNNGGSWVFRKYR